MNKGIIFILKSLRKIYNYFFGKSVICDRGITDPNKASELICQLLETKKPCMIARFGSTELYALTNYLGIIAPNHSIWKYIQGKQSEWWWEDNVKKQMTEWSGFFPSTDENLMRFGDLMVEDSKEVDILGSWLSNESYIIDKYKLKLQKISLLYLEPYWANNPWSRILEGKRVLVIHPFVKQMEQIYKTKRHLIFNNESVLPEFKLLTIQAVQSLGGDYSGFDNWFEALDWMKSEMDKVDFDIALIGCGAYGFPLAAHAKRTGHQAIHFGGCLQLLFGIKGNRWENPLYGAVSLGKKNAYNELFNQYWEYPDKEYIPKTAAQVENFCYWKKQIK